MTGFALDTERNADILSNILMRPTHSFLFQAMRIRNWWWYNSTRKRDLWWYNKSCNNTSYTFCGMILQLPDSSFCVLHKTMIERWRHHMMIHVRRGCKANGYGIAGKKFCQRSDFGGA